VKIVDINLLLYVVNQDDPNCERARLWWEGLLSGREPVGMAWAVILGFLRISTNRRAFLRPLPPADALALMDEWLEQPPVRVVSPGESHWSVLKRFAGTLGFGGNLTTDAHLAALAIEHGATLCSADADFSRFHGLHWENPLA
jgi:hypothetical protein